MTANKYQLFDFGGAVARVQEETGDDDTPTGDPHVTIFEPAGAQIIISGADCEGLIKLGRYLQQWSSARVPQGESGAAEPNSSAGTAKTGLQFKPV